MKILLLGSGGREHALAWKILQSPCVETLFVAPGNAGTQAGGAVNVALKADDFEGVKHFVLAEGVDMVVVGPEDPLVKGIYDFFRDDEALSRIPVIGPSKAGAQLEGSKDFAKQFMRRHNIPTAAYQTFDGNHLADGLAFLETLQPPYVLKADGLCAGKGVLIVPTLDEACGGIVDCVRALDSKYLHGEFPLVMDITVTLGTLTPETPEECKEVLGKLDDSLKAAFGLAGKTRMYHVNDADKGINDWAYLEVEG